MEITPPVVFFHAGALGSLSLAEVISCGVFLLLLFLFSHSGYSVKYMLNEKVEMVGLSG